MQMLIEEMNWNIDDAPPLKKYLEKEQEQIENAFGDGYDEGVFMGEIFIEDSDNVITPNEYYQSKYKDENVDR